MTDDSSERPDRLRRAILAAAPVTMALGYCSSSAFAQDAAAEKRQRALSSLGLYCGTYEAADGRWLGVERFINDVGEAGMLLADYRTSLVRPLRETADGSFTAGPTFDAATPISLTVRFEIGVSGRGQSVVLAYSDGAEIRASRSAARDIEITFRQGDAMLAGTLILPEGVGPHPAIILLHGSGPLTRYSFGPYARFFNSLGLAVLVYDKRGTGSSSGRLLDASTGAPEILWQAHFPDDLLADSLAAARFLQSRPDIDGRRIGVWGSSEGGMLATQVAAKSRNIAFAVNSSGFIGPLWRTILYQGEGGMRAAGKAEADIARALEFNRFWMEVARTGKGYDDYLQRRDILIKAGAYDQLFYYSASYRSLAQMRWSWEHILAFDSSQALSNITCPVLGLFGAADMLTEVQIAASGMRAKAPTAVTHIIPNASHSLMEVPSRQGMAPGVFDTLAEWLRQVAIA